MTEFNSKMLHFSLVALIPVPIMVMVYVLGMAIGVNKFASIVLVCLNFNLHFLLIFNVFILILSIYDSCLDKEPELKKENRKIAPLKVSDKYVFKIPTMLLEDDTVFSELEKLASKEEIILNDFSYKNTNLQKLISLVLLSKRIQKLEELNAPETMYLDFSEIKKHLEKFKQDASQTARLKYIESKISTQSKLAIPRKTLDKVVKLYMLREIYQSKIELTEDLYLLTGLPKEKIEIVSRDLREEVYEELNEIFSEHTQELRNQEKILTSKIVDVINM